MRKDLKVMLLAGLFSLLALIGCTATTEQTQEANCIVDAWRARSLEYGPPQLYVFLGPEQSVPAIAWYMGYTVFYEDGTPVGATRFDSLGPSELLSKDFYSATLQLAHGQDIPLELQFISMDFNYGHPPSSNPQIISATRFRIGYIDGVEVVHGDFYSGEIVELLAQETWTPGIPVDVISILDDGFDYIYIVQPKWQDGPIRWHSFFAFRVNSGINACSYSNNVPIATEEGVIAISNGNEHEAFRHWHHGFNPAQNASGWPKRADDVADELTPFLFSDDFQIIIKGELWKNESYYYFYKLTDEKWLKVLAVYNRESGREIYLTHGETWDFELWEQVPVYDFLELLQPGEYILDVGGWWGDSDAADLYNNFLRFIK